MANEVPLPIEQIRERAYDLWDRNHRPDGQEVRFWLMAERELKAERASRGTGPDINPPAGVLSDSR